MKDKSVFKIDKIDAAKLSKSYGLLNAPVVEFVSVKAAKIDRVSMLK